LTGEVSFAVHKTVLIARSEVFAAMLTASSDNSEKATNRMVIKDIKPKVVKELLRFLYTGKVYLQFSIN
jgi:hypothetical protein